MAAAVEAGVEVARKKLTGYDFWRSIGSPKYIVAPMVHQSELAFRMLTRRYGAQLCYTPMLSSNAMRQSKTYRKRNMEVCEADRPLIVQFAGHDPAVLLEAARYAEPYCDAVDLNLGCPQGIAKRGRFGSFLLEEKDLVIEIVTRMAAELTVPVTVKIRMLPEGVAPTIEYCRRLEKAGASMLCVHGRTREQKGQKVGSCDWDGIKAIKESLGIPVVANGGIGCLADVHRCLEYTGCDGVMSSEAVLENPALFCDNIDPETGEFLTRDRLVREYLELAERYPPYHNKVIRAHLFKFMFTELDVFADLRAGLVLPRQSTESMAERAMNAAARSRTVAAYLAAAGAGDDAVATVPEPIAASGAGGSVSPEAGRNSQEGEHAGTVVAAGSAAMGIVKITEDVGLPAERRREAGIPEAEHRTESIAGGLSTGNAWYMRHRSARIPAAKEALLSGAKSLGYEGELSSALRMERKFQNSRKQKRKQRAAAARAAARGARLGSKLEDDEAAGGAGGSTSEEDDGGEVCVDTATLMAAAKEVDAYDSAGEAEAKGDVVEAGEVVTGCGNLFAHSDEDDY